MYNNRETAKAYTEPCKLSDITNLIHQKPDCNDHQSDRLDPTLLEFNSISSKRFTSPTNSKQCLGKLSKLSNPVPNKMDTAGSEAIEQPERKEAFLVLTCSILLSFILDTTWIAFPIFYVEFSEYFDGTKSLIGGIGSVQNAMCQTFQLVTSGLIEAYGCKPVAIVGSLLVFFSFVLNSFANSIAYLYITYGVIGGVGQSLLNLPNAVIIQQYFNKHRSLATSAMMMGGGLGLITGPLVMRYLISTYSWRGALLIYAGISLHSLPLVLFYNSPKAYQPTSNIHMREIVRKIFDFQLLKHRIFIAFCICMFLLKFNTFGFYHHLPNRMVFYGFSKDLAAIVLTITAACSLIGRIMSGILGHFKCTNSSLAFGCFVMLGGVCTIFIGFTTSYRSAAMLSGMYGFCHGSLFLMVNLLLIHHFGVERFARCRGIMNLFNGSAGLLATPFAGWLFDITGNYNIPFRVTGSIGICGGFFFLIVLLIDRIRYQK